MASLNSPVHHRVRDCLDESTRNQVMPRPDPSTSLPDRSSYNIHTSRLLSVHPRCFHVKTLKAGSFYIITMGEMCKMQLYISKTNWNLCMMFHQSVENHKQNLSDILSNKTIEATTATNENGGCQTGCKWYQQISNMCYHL